MANRPALGSPNFRLSFSASFSGDDGRSVPALIHAWSVERETRTFCATTATGNPVREFGLDPLA